MGQLAVPLKRCLRSFLSTQAVRHLLMHMAGSEHLQGKMMELEGLKDQAGQVAGVWGKKPTNQPTKILAKQSCNSERAPVLQGL